MPAGWGDVRDITGEVVRGLNQTSPDVFVAEIDLDRTLVHLDFNQAVATLLAEHAGDVEAETLDEYCAAAGRCMQQGDLLAESNFHLLRRTDAGYAKGVSVRKLLQQYSIRPLRSYQIDARRQINAQRQTGRAPAPKTRDGWRGATMSGARAPDGES